MKNTINITKGTTKKECNKCARTFICCSYEWKRNSEMYIGCGEVTDVKSSRYMFRWCKKHKLHGKRYHK